MTSILTTSLLVFLHPVWFVMGRIVGPHRSKVLIPTRQRVVPRGDDRWRHAPTRDRRFLEVLSASWRLDLPLTRLTPRNAAGRARGKDWILTERLQVGSWGRAIVSTEPPPNFSYYLLFFDREVVRVASFRSYPSDPSRTNHPKATNLSRRSRGGVMTPGQGWRRTATLHGGRR